MTFSERNMLALLGTNCQFLEIFLKNIHTIPFAQQVYLIIILVRAENAVSYKYVVAKGRSILTAFWDNNVYSEDKLNQHFGSGCCLSWISILTSRLGLWNTPTRYLQRVRTPSNECPRYDIKPSDWMRTIPSWQLLQGLLWPWVVAPDRVLSICRIEQTMCAKQYSKRFNWVQKRASNRLRILSTKCVYKLYIYIYKDHFALNNLQWLICYETQPNQIIYI